MSCAADAVPGSTVRRAAQWLLLLALVALSLEAASLVGLRFVARRWITPAAVRAERLAVRAQQPDEAEGSEDLVESPYRLPWRMGELREVLHPYTGFVYEVPAGDVHSLGDPLRALGFHYDQSPIPHRAGRNDFVVLLCGGSVAQAFELLGGAQEIVQRLATLPGAAGKRIHVGSVALGGFKQPQQLFAVAYLLSLGHRLDVVVNLDGFNEATLGPSENVPQGIASFFPRLWRLRVQDAPDRRRQAMIGETLVLRERRSRWARMFHYPFLGTSTTAALLWKVEDTRLARRISTLERDVVVEAAPEAGAWTLAPPHHQAASTEEIIVEVVDVWRESSVQLSRLARANGIRYFHFLQPNQYVPDSKPMNDAERRAAILRASPPEQWVPRVYPYMIGAGRELREAGVSFFDMTQVFAAVAEPVYTDNCCHFSQSGNRILGRAMADAMATSWRGSPDRSPGA